MADDGNSGADSMVVSPTGKWMIADTELGMALTAMERMLDQGSWNLQMTDDLRISVAVGCLLGVISGPHGIETVGEALDVVDDEFMVIANSLLEAFETTYREEHPA